MKKFKYNFHDLKISANQIEKAMGYKPGNSPDPFPELISGFLQSASEYCDIQGGYIIEENISFDARESILRIGNEDFIIKKIVYSQIAESGKIALFLCTAGSEIGEWSKRLMNEGEMMKGYVVDVIGSETVETAMDRIHTLLGEDMKQQGLNITNRYSPGYCGWNVSEQQKLFKFFPADFCGIKLSDTSLMYPVKSVSGIIGIGNEVKMNNYPCKLCDDKNCIYRGKR